MRPDEFPSRRSNSARRILAVIFHCFGPHNLILAWPSFGCPACLFSGKVGAARARLMGAAASPR